MKKLLILLLLMIFSVPAFGQDENSEPVPYFAAGMALPLMPSEFSDLYIPGMHVGVGLDRPLRDNYFLNLDLHMSYHGLDKNAYRESRDLDWNIYNPLQGQTALIYLTANFKWKFTTTPIGRPYVLAGAGPMVHRRAKIDIRAGDQFFETISDENNFGLAFSVGLGFEFKASKKYAIFFDSRMIFGTVKDNITDMPIRAGFRFIPGTDKE
ncbi:outer membrane beta-barrel protein [candidate division KSB1 bacterium]